MTYLPILVPTKEFPRVTEAEAKAIWLEAKKPRVRLFVKVLWFTGLRLNEVLALRAGDVNRQGLDFSLSVIRLKKRKEQKAPPLPLPIPRSLGLDIADYIQSADIKPSGLLFPGHKSGYQYQVKACAKRAGLINWKDIHPHCFRHGFIYHKASQGIHPYLLSKLVDHSDLRMTLQYYEPTEEDLRKAMEA